MFRLYYAASGTSAYSTSDIPFNATADQFKSSLNSLPCFGSTFKPNSVTLTTVNNSRTWIIEYDSYRSKSCQVALSINTTNLAASANVTYIQVQSHSDPLKGNFRLSYGSVDIVYKGSLDIPYNIAANDLQQCLSASLSLPQIEV